MVLRRALAFYDTPYLVRRDETIVLLVELKRHCCLPLTFQHAPWTN